MFLLQPVVMMPTAEPEVQPATVATSNGRKMVTLAATAAMGEMVVMV